MNDEHITHVPAEVYDHMLTDGEHEANDKLQQAARRAKELITRSPDDEAEQERLRRKNRALLESLQQSTPAPVADTSSSSSSSCDTSSSSSSSCDSGSF